LAGTTDEAYTTRGIAALTATLNGNTRLTYLNLKGNALRPAGLSKLAPVVAIMSALAELDLARNELCGVDQFGVGQWSAVGVLKLVDELNRAPPRRTPCRIVLKQNKLDAAAEQALRAAGQRSNMVVFVHA
jgi:hypothetical protein